MSIIAAAVKHMLAAKMPAEAIVAAVAEMEAAVPRDAQAERRREKDRERKRLRKSAESAEPAEIQDAPALNDVIPNLETLEVNLNPPPLKVPRPKSDFPRDAFEQWYSIYPRHEAPKRARKAFLSVERSGEVSFADLIAATQRFAAIVSGKERQFIPHPATWLNGGCWADETPAPPPAAGGSPTPKSGDVVAGKFWVHRESEQFEAWREYELRVKGKPPPTDRNGGWLFPSEFPPQHHS